MSLTGHVFCKVCRSVMMINFSNFCHKCIRDSEGGFIKVSEKTSFYHPTTHYIPFKEIVNTRIVLIEKFEDVENNIKTLFQRAALKILIDKGVEKRNLFTGNDI